MSKKNAAASIKLILFGAVEKLRFKLKGTSPVVRNTFFKTLIIAVKRESRGSLHGRLFLKIINLLKCLGLHEAASIQ